LSTRIPHLLRVHPFLIQITQIEDINQAVIAQCKKMVFCIKTLALMFVATEILGISISASGCSTNIESLVGVWISRVEDAIIGNTRW
jgi:hypothetical protein